MQQQRKPLNIRRTFITTMLVLALSGVAQAAELFTPPFVISDGLFECRILNVSTTDRTVQVQLFDTSGNVIEDSGEVTLEPLGDLLASAGTTKFPFFCKFTVQGGKGSIRASGSHRQLGNTTLVVPAE
jgi:hypothetical protein